MITIDIGYAILYAACILGLTAWVIHTVKDNAQTRYYWLGRSDGWNMHRRMLTKKTMTDKVFDYDKD